ncbi:MAG: chromosome segregation protein SMC [Verrucomicrobia bacterium]|nr:MAG: chromosome segregation protein SMC [Verrucomicrobiota bacterium]
MVKRFRVECFKSIESVELELGNVNVFIGANGGGKSNLLEAFGVLAAAAFGRVDPESLVRRGCRPGWLFQPLFRDVPTDTETTVSADDEATTYCVRLASPSPGRPAAWQFRREVWKEGGKVIVDREASMEGSKGDPQAGLAALRLAEIPVGDQAANFLRSLAGYSIYAPETPVLRGVTQETQLREPVGLAGGRVADAVAELIKQEQAGEKLRSLFQAGMEWFSGFGSVEIKVPAGVRHNLAFMDRFFRSDNHQFYVLGPTEVNEGALYLLFVAVLCLHKASPKLFALDNADHGLNPLLAKNLMQAMCQWLLESKEQRQVLMTTQNPLVLDGLPLQDDRVRLFTVDRDNRGRTTVKRFVITEEHRKKAQEGWTLSRMWVNGLIGGIPNV